MPLGPDELTPTGLSPSMAGLPRPFGWLIGVPCRGPKPHASMVWAAPLSFAATGGMDVICLFLRVLRCFNSPGVSPSDGIARWRGAGRVGFPHSEIGGSKLTSSSPPLIAGSRVLHRLLVPRHPLYALINLTS